jgi:hypothetical protein
VSEGRAAATIGSRSRTLIPFASGPLPAWRKVHTRPENEAATVLPSAKSLPGFQGGYWARAMEGDVEHSILLFDTEQNARGAAAQMSDAHRPAPL